MYKSWQKQDAGGQKALKMLAAVALPLGGGFLISLLTRGAMEQFAAFRQPPLAPPAWLFPVAWSILYILMGVASYFIYMSKDSKERRAALTIYLVQLGFNFLWSIVFFNLNWFWPALIWLLIMWAMIIALVVKARRISTPAFYLLLPYLIWCTFAAYLNAGIAYLN